MCKISIIEVVEILNNTFFCLMALLIYYWGSITEIDLVINKKATLKIEFIVITVFIELLVNIFVSK